MERNNSDGELCDECNCRRTQLYMQAKGVNEFPVDMDKIEWVWYEIDFHVECGQKLRSNHLNIENGAAH